VSSTSDIAHPWIPDQGDGTYRNPIICADYSDPDIVRVGGDFFMTASSFNCTPGMPVLHSKDLVNWKLIGHAIENLPHPRYAEVQPGCGVWAPAIRFHAGKFWIFYPTPDEGIFLITAEHPAGQWSEPHCVQAGRGLIDPCPLWDDDGKAYLVHAYAGSRAGIKHRLRVCPMVPDGSRLLGDGEIIFHQPERHPTLEGPKFLKRDGWYYVLAPAGGVATGWQVVLRSRNIFGPYEDKIVLAQGSTDVNGPHQGALVDAADGGWWFIHFQDAGIFGRIVHLQPVEWRDGWPLMGKNGEPVMRHLKPVLIVGQEPFAPQTSDEFDGNKLAPQWQWHANHQPGWHSLAARKNWLRLFPQASGGDLTKAPNLLLQKFPAQSFIAETLLELSPENSGDEAGLIVAGQTYAALALRRAKGKNQIVFRNNGNETILRESSDAQLGLRVAVSRGGLCTLSFAEGNKFVTAPETFQATPGMWIGAKMGIYAIKRDAKPSAAHADFKHFRFSPP
jgi:beta-xylosidase